MGGWVIDSVEQQKHHGASVVFIDDRLDCECLQMYREPKRGSIPEPVRVMGSQNEEESAVTTALAQRLQDDINTNSSAWRRFSEAVGKLARNEPMPSRGALS